MQIEVAPLYGGIEGLALFDINFASSCFDPVVEKAEFAVNQVSVDLWSSVQIPYTPGYV